MTISNDRSQRSNDSEGGIFDPTVTQIKKEDTRTGPDRLEPDRLDRLEPDRPDRPDRTGPDRSDIRGAEASPQKKQQQQPNAEDPSGSSRGITAHLIHDKNTSITVPCIVFNEESAGYDPGWIYWSYEFLFFRPRGLWTRRPAQTGPRGQSLRFPRFDPMILCWFLATIR